MPNPPLHCASCKKPIETRARNPCFPFCSVRCRQVDLGKWLGEEYKVAANPAGPGENAEQEDELPPDPVRDGE